MSLSKKDAIELLDLGFKRPEYEDRVYPFDMYSYENSLWVVGGRILPEGTLSCDEKIYNEGVWIPSLAYN